MVERREAKGGSVSVSSPRRRAFVSGSERAAKDAQRTLLETLSDLIRKLRKVLRIYCSLPCATSPPSGFDGGACCRAPESGVTMMIFTKEELWKDALNHE